MLYSSKERITDPNVVQTQAYFTSLPVVKKLREIFISLNLKGIKTVVDPCVGHGNLLGALPLSMLAPGSPYRFILKDIVDYRENLPKHLQQHFSPGDFLSLHPPAEEDCFLFLANPPYKKNTNDKKNTLAFEFVLRMQEWPSTVGSLMILVVPAIFMRNEKLDKVFPDLHWHVVHAQLLPVKNAFYVLDTKGKTSNVSVRTGLLVLEKKDFQRLPYKQPKIIPELQFVSKSCVNNWVRDQVLHKGLRPEEIVIEQSNPGCPVSYMIRQDGSRAGCTQNQKVGLISERYQGNGYFYVKITEGEHAEALHIFLSRGFEMLTHAAHCCTVNPYLKISTIQETFWTFYRKEYRRS